MARVGILFTLDAVFAIALLASAILLYGTIQTEAFVSPQNQYAAQDVLLSLNAITLSDINESWSQELQNSTELTHQDTLLYSLGLLHVTNDSRKQYIIDLINQTIPSHVGVAVRIESTDVLRRSTPAQKQRIRVAYQQITGIDEGKPVAGTSSSAYLNKIRNKRTSSYAYFGGFVGQGNVSTTIVLPGDVNSSRITGYYAELDTPAEFDVQTNGIICASHTPQSANMTSERFDLSSCSSHLTSGNNTVSFVYENLSQAYIAGGFVRVDYTTDLFTTSSDQGTSTYIFPGIQGVINLYDSAIVPGTITNVTARLHYETNQSNVLTYLSVGEKTVYSSNETGEIDVLLDANDFISAGIDFESISNTTVPIRFASFNATTQIIENSSNADVVVITDYSGSMRLEVNGTSTGSIGDLQDCEADVYTKSDIRRSHLARCLDKELVNTLLNYSGNRIYPVHFYNNRVYQYINPQDQEALSSFYETFTSSFPQNANGGTGLASALSQAYEIFDTHSEENRTRVIVFMSDGLPSNCARDPDLPYGFWQYFHPDYNNPQCDNRQTEFHPTNTCSGSQTASNCQVGGSCSLPIDNTYEVAQDLYNDFNVTIHSVAFGPVGECDSARQLLESVSTLTNGTFSASSDIQGLRDVYTNISQEIISALELSSQTLTIPQNTTRSTLYKDSYIEFTVDSTVPAPQPNEIELTRQTSTLSGCTDTVSFPDDIRIRDAVLTSYSAQHWTDEVRINDTTVYNLSDYLVSYPRLGDPYRVYLPVDLLSSQNTISMRTGDSPSNQTGCSTNNSIIYTAYVPSSTTRTPVLEQAQGCNWAVEYDDMTFENITIPASYSGNQSCLYTNSNITYDTSDSSQQAAYQLLNIVDFDDDGRIFISLSEEDLEIVVTELTSVPFLWGPILVQTEVWE